MTYRPTIYIASITKHAEKWLELAKSHGDLFILGCAWPRHVVRLKHHEPDLKQMGGFWKDNFKDLCDCNFLIVYAAPGDILRGALVEAGYAFRCNIPVFVVGEHESYGTWQSLATIVPGTIEDAIEKAYEDFNNFDNLV